MEFPLKKKQNSLTKRNFLCGCMYKHLHMPITDFNSTYLTPLLEKINKEDKSCFLMGDFNIDLMKMDSKFDNSQFYNTMCWYFFFTAYSSTH